MILRRTWFGLFGLLCAPALLWGAYEQARTERTWDLVEAAATAYERVSYRGEAASRHSRWKKSLEIQNDARTGRTRYEFGEGRGFTRSGPSSRMTDPVAWCLDFAALRENYRAKVTGHGRFLGRATVRVDLRPREEGRPTVRLTLDAKTSLPLKVLTERADGTLYRMLAFRDIEFGRQEVKPSRWKSRNVGEVDLDPWEPAYLPSGFRRIESRVNDWPTPRMKFVYTDGITAFELQQGMITTPAVIEASLARKMGWEKTNRVMTYLLGKRRAILAGSDGRGAAVCRRSHKQFHRSYELRIGDREIDLVSRGDLDEEETQRVLRSLRPR